MNRILAVMAMGTGVFLGAQALAVDAMQYSTASQRRMTVKVVGCMKKRMAADRTTKRRQRARIRSTSAATV
jgi:hypothetical protein